MVEEAVDYDRLEEYFRALAFGSRLELLHQLRMPRALSEIRVRSRRVREGESPDRVIARQSIQEHLDKLLEIGVVVAQDARGGRGRREYVLNGPRLYQIMEEFRQIGTLAAEPPNARDETVGVSGARRAVAHEGAHLVLVHGLFEGRTYPLERKRLEQDRGWVLGRKPGLHVSLDYDPFVSLENSEILVEPGGYALVDLRGSKNGTSLNWRRLARDERAPLRAGDVIGVGRSLLVFRPA